MEMERWADMFDTTENDKREQITNAIRNKHCPCCGMTGDMTCWYGDGICGEHNDGWDNGDAETQRIAREMIRIETGV